MVKKNQDSAKKLNRPISNMRNEIRTYITKSGKGKRNVNQNRSVTYESAVQNTNKNAQKKADLEGLTRIDK